MVQQHPTAAQQARRTGYTLLEVLLASAIAVMLLAALYVAVDIQVNNAQSGRETVQRGAVLRTVIKQISLDVNSALPLSDKARWTLDKAKASAASGPSAAGAAGANGAAAPAATDPAAATGAAATTTTSNTGTSNYDNSTTSLAPNANTFGIPFGIQGNATQLTIYIKKPPREALVNPNKPAKTNNSTGQTMRLSPTGGNNADSTNSVPVNGTQSNGVDIPVVSDIRRVTYWLVGGDGTSNGEGLARMVAFLPTSEEATNLLPPNVDNESSYIFASEIRSVLFEYWDGTTWQQTWDSASLGADQVTPKGSPVAIAVTLGIAQGEEADAPVKTYRHVIAIRTANGNTPQPGSTTDSTTTPTTGGGN